MDGYFFEENSSIFKECFKGCLECKSSNKCLECDSKNGFLFIKFDDYKKGDRKIIFIFLIF